MSFIELFLLAVGLSMDAFAVAVCAGLAMRTSAMKKALIIGLYFGIFQAAMPLLGYFAATFFASMIISYDHWIAFVLLCFIGGKMIVESLKKDGQEPSDTAGTPCASEASEASEASSAATCILKPIRR